MVFNKDGNIFCGQRLDNKAEAWQLPQGGINEDELTLDAGYRELKEETSITNVTFVSEYPEWLSYDIPLPLINNLWGGKYRGQTQRWLLFYFSGQEEEININTSDPEFKNWIWIKPSELPEKAISFKKNVYKKINELFIPILDNYISSNI